MRRDMKKKNQVNDLQIYDTRKKIAIHNVNMARSILSFNIKFFFYLSIH